MAFFSPLLRRGVVAQCRPVYSATLSTPAKQWVRQSSAATAFRPSLVALLPRTPPPAPPSVANPSSASPSSHVHPESTSTAPSRKPEDLYPESFPIDEKDLVNPSGRIYAVRRPPDEEDGESKKALQDRKTFQESLFVPLAEARDPPLFGALLFFVLGGGFIYCGAAAYSVKSTETAARNIDDEKGGGIFGDFSSFFGVSGNGAKERTLSVDERQLRAAQKQQLAQKMGRGLRRLLKRCDQLGIPQEGKKAIARMYTWAAESYLHLREEKAALVPIFAINTVIFLGWRVSMIPSLRNSLQVFMRKYFLHAPASGRTYTMLTSTFSHRGGLHFFFNHYAMWSFGAASIAAFSVTSSHYTPQASLTPHVFAFFCTAGIASALASHLITALSFRFVAARRGLAAARLSIGRMGSLGASGSAYAMIVMTALTFPDNAVV
jgi:membrane associated rhomboid family serine protease